ncbi:MAG TPA: T9SS type A sorting domain-containing protein, partial [Chitinophagaceae bacterium]|nr:T9SS type A sorting domain-containing protein [Chitinophagaceae bacterium]
NRVDDFHYVYQGLDTGRLMVTAKVEYLDYTDPWAKCGIMIRQSLEGSSPQAMICITSGNGAAFQYRISDQGSSSTRSLGNIFIPYWLRLVREGNEFTGYVSPDGHIWTALDSVAIAMDTRTFAGIAYTSHNENLAGHAIVDSVSLQNLDFSTIPGDSGEIYPNPATYQVYFSDPAFFEAGSGISVELLDGSGRMVLQQPLETGLQGPVIRVALPAGLPNGYYFLRLLNSRGGKAVRKLLILR